MPALVLTLERAGVVDLPRVASLARCARALNAAPDAGARGLVLTEWQSALALVERLSTVGSVDIEATGRLLDGLAALRPENGRFGDRLAGWITTDLAPALGASVASVNGDAGSSGSMLEPAMLEALAARAHGRPTG